MEAFLLAILKKFFVWPPRPAGGTWFPLTKPADCTNCLQNWRNKGQPREPTSDLDFSNNSEQPHNIILEGHCSSLMILYFQAHGEGCTAAVDQNFSILKKIKRGFCWAKAKLIMPLGHRVLHHIMHAHFLPYYHYCPGGLLGCNQSPRSEPC